MSGKEPSPPEDWDTSSKPLDKSDEGKQEPLRSVASDTIDKPAEEL